METLVRPALTAPVVLLIETHLNPIFFFVWRPLLKRTDDKQWRIYATKTCTLNNACKMHIAYTHPATIAQSKHTQKRFKYISTTHTPHPAIIHACSRMLTQKSRCKMRPRTSSAAGTSRRATHARAARGHSQIHVHRARALYGSACARRQRTSLYQQAPGRRWRCRGSVGGL